MFTYMKSILSNSYTNLGLCNISWHAKQIITLGKNLITLAPSALSATVIQSQYIYRYSYNKLRK